MFALYVAIFLLILIMISTKEEMKTATDVVLGRKVPLIVFIKNKGLLKQIMTDNLVSEVKKQELRVQAQFNEYMHSLLRKSNVQMKLDEKIGLTYFNVDQTQ